VLVLGAGLAGLLHVKLAAALGAGRILATDVLELRRDSAKRFGAESVFDGRADVPKLVREANEGRGADLVIVCAAQQAVYQQAFRSVDRGGTILIFALPDPGVDVPTPLYELWKDGVTIVSSYAGPPRETLEALELLRAHRVRVEDMITPSSAARRDAPRLRLVADGRECLKVVIRPQE